MSKINNKTLTMERDTFINPLNNTSSKILDVSVEESLEDWNKNYLNKLDNFIFTDLNKKRSKIKKIIESGNFNAAKDIKPWYIILPNQQLKKLWDIFNCLACIFSIFVCTIDISFDFECITDDHGESIKNIYLILFVIFSLDIGICCLTAYLDERNNYSFQIDVIVTNYIKSGNLFFDIASTFPFFLVIPFDLNNCFLPQINTKKLFYFLNFFRMTKINQFFDLLERLAPKYALILRLIKQFAMIIFLANIVGVLFCGTSPTVGDIFTGECKIYPESSDQFRKCKVEILKSQFWNIYGYSLFLGLLMTMGNDLKTEKSFEQIVFITCTIVSTIMNASIYGNVAVMLSKVSGGVSPILKEKIDTMKGYMNYMKFNEGFKFQIEEYHLNIWFKQRNMMYDDTVFGDMSLALQKILLLQQWRPSFFINSKILKLISGNFMIDMLLKLKPRIFMTNDIIITEGESNTEVYFNSNTCLCKIYIGGQWIKDIEKGHYFGEISIFLRSRRRTATVLSGRDSDFLYINGKDFQQILRNYPDDMENIKNNAIQALIQSMKFYPSSLFAKLVPNNNLKDYLFRKSIHCEDEEEDFHFNNEDKNTIDSLEYNYKMNQINFLLNQVKEKIKKIEEEKEIEEDDENNSSNTVDDI